MVQEKLCLCRDFSCTYSFLLSKGSFQLYKFLVRAKLTTGKWTRIIPNIRTVEVGNFNRAEIWHWSTKSLFYSYVCVPVWHLEPIGLYLKIWYWSTKSLSYATRVSVLTFRADKIRVNIYSWQVVPGLIQFRTKF